MGVLIIDENKCKKDGFCVKECPGRIIQLDGGNGYPQMVSWGESTCTSCGHCVAICPHGALSHTKVPVAECTVIKEELRINEEKAEQFLRYRRSIRLYEDKPVEQEKIRRLIEVARYAPTAGNSQLVEWLVVTDKTTIKGVASTTAELIRKALNDEPRMAAVMPYLPLIVKSWDEGYDSVLRNAPVVIVASAPKEAMNGMVDLTLALSYLTLMAPTMGLGTCLAGLVQRALLSSPSLKDTLGIPAEHPHYYPIMLGYTKAKYYRLPERKPPRITFK
ncbi:MAG: nitroreductase family protein [Proteobacteria bacterium]|nr:nitroreductase family protein [Pseudomonadota bacterium]